MSLNERGRPRREGGPEIEQLGGGYDQSNGTSPAAEAVPISERRAVRL
jgi:hypothetical protein